MTAASLGAELGDFGQVAGLGVDVHHAQFGGDHLADPHRAAVFTGDGDQDVHGILPLHGARASG
jgi:hypothetical protein